MSAELIGILSIGIPTLVAVIGAIAGAAWRMGRAEGVLVGHDKRFDGLEGRLQHLHEDVHALRQRVDRILERLPHPD